MFEPCTLVVFFISFNQRSRNPVEIPPANYANLRFINAGICDLKVTGHGLNLDVSGTQVSGLFGFM